MAVIEWEGEVRLTIGYISRADQLDLFAVFNQSEWLDLKPPDNKMQEGLYMTRRLMETDAMVAAVATKRIEICKGGKWLALKAGKAYTIKDTDIQISFPPTYQMINDCPRQLVDLWVESAVERNGTFNANMRFFSSPIKTSGKTNSAATSEPPPSSTEKTASS